MMELFKYSVIPLFTEMFRIIYRRKPLKLEGLAKIISVFIILSALPFLLGIVNQPVASDNLEKFGLSNAHIFIGVFLKGHSASISFSSAALMLLIYFNREKDQLTKLFYFLLIALATYVIYKTYVRTGWVIYLAGGFFIYFWGQKFSVIIKRVPLLLVGIGGLAALYLSSPALQLRLTDSNIWKEEQNVETVNLGSGRLKYAETSINYWTDSGVGGIVLGLGIEHARDLMADAVGKRLVAHNGFINIIQNTGLLGVLLFGLFSYYMIKITLNLRKSSLLRLPLNTLMLAYFFTLLFQGAHYIWIQILLSIYLALALLEQEQYKIQNAKLAELEKGKDSDEK